MLLSFGSDTLCCLDEGLATPQMSTRRTFKVYSSAVQYSVEQSTVPKMGFKCHFFVIDPLAAFLQQQLLATSSRDLVHGLCRLAFVTALLIVWCHWPRGGARQPSTSADATTAVDNRRWATRTLASRSMLDICKIQKSHRMIFNEAWHRSWKMAPRVVEPFIKQEPMEQAALK